jgi:hypothetical protein
MSLTHSASRDGLSAPPHSDLAFGKDVTVQTHGHDKYTRIMEMCACPMRGITSSRPLAAEDSRRSLTRVTSECAWMSFKKWRFEAG